VQWSIRALQVSTATWYYADHDYSPLAPCAARCARLASKALRGVFEGATTQHGTVDEGDRRGVDRLTIQQAVRRLGISEGAVRKRVARGSLEHDKEDDGRVYVYLDAGGRRGVDVGQDEGVDPNSNALISRPESEVAFLRDQVHRQQEIIAQKAVTGRNHAAAHSGASGSLRGR
jgi:hypothetical protein